MKTKHAKKNSKTRQANSARRKHRETRSNVGSSVRAKNRESRQPNTSPMSDVESAEQWARTEDLSPKDREATQSGDLTGVSRNRFSVGESAAELFEEGRDLEGELVESLGTTREEDEGILSVRKLPGERIPDYKNRNRL
jgi:hypothetical protein